MNIPQGNSKTDADFSVKRLYASIFEDIFAELTILYNFLLPSIQLILPELRQKGDLQLDFNIKHFKLNKFVLSEMKPASLDI